MIFICKNCKKAIPKVLNPLGMFRKEDIFCDPWEMYYFHEPMINLEYLEYKSMEVTSYAK